MKSVVFAVSLIVLAGRVDASPIGSVKGTCDVLLGTASAFSLSSVETSARVALFAPDGSFPFQTASMGAAGAVQSLGSLSSVFAPADLNRASLVVSSVAAPLAPPFHEPAAWVIVLIGLGIVALGSVRLRR